MIWFALLLLVIAGVAFMTWRKSEQDTQWMSVRRLSGIAAIACGFFGVTIVTTSLFYTQDPGEAVVRLSFTGQIAGVTTEPGMHIKGPWESNKVFDIRNQKIDMDSTDPAESADNSAITVPLAGGANANVSITVLYSIKPSSVENIYTDFKSQENLIDSALVPSLRDIVRRESAKFEPLQIKQDRSKLSASIQETLTQWEDSYGVVVEAVNLGDIKLDDKTEEAISGVIQSQQEVERSRAGLQRAQIDAEVTKTQAQADADADQIIRCGATVTEETQVIDDVETTVTIVTPKNSSECDNRLNEQVLTARWIEAMKEMGAYGNMVIIVPEGSDGPILNVPSP